MSGERLLDLTIPRESVKNKIRNPAGCVLRCGSGASPCGSHKVFVFTAVRKQAIEVSTNNDRGFTRIVAGQIEVGDEHSANFPCVEFRPPVKVNVVNNKGVPICIRDDSADAPAMNDKVLRVFVKVSTPKVDTAAFNQFLAKKSNASAPAGRKTLVGRNNSNEVPEE